MHRRVHVSEYIKRKTWTDVREALVALQAAGGSPMMIRGEARLSHAATKHKTQYGQFKVPSTRREFLINQSQPN